MEETELILESVGLSAVCEGSGVPVAARHE